MSLNHLIPLALLAVVPASVAVAGPAVYVGTTVSAGDRVAIDRLDHSSWDALLRKYVDVRGQVNYAAWHKSSEDRQQLERYLRHLSAADLQQASSKEGQLAFWINAYNSVTIHGILREYPTSSIRNHTARVFGYNIWKDLQLQVGGSAYSLEAMEHEKLRKMNEPRIHFAIVCASISCPRLLNRAFTPSNVGAQLATNTDDFFSNPANFRYDAARNRVHLSSILKWFATDFGATAADQQRWISHHVTDRTARQALASGTASISYLSYDWGLNEQRPQAARQARR